MICRCYSCADGHTDYSQQATNNDTHDMNRLYIAAAGAVVLFGLGWMIGASGRSERELAKRTAEQRADVLDVRGKILEGRVALFENNFGQATQLFSEARTVLEQRQTTLREEGDGARAGELEVPLGHLRDAQRLALALDHGAHRQATDALRTLSSAR